MKKEHDSIVLPCQRQSVTKNLLIDVIVSQRYAYPSITRNIQVNLSSSAQKLTEFAPSGEAFQSQAGG